MANDRKETFMCPEQMAELIGKVAFDIDRSKSEVVRACILLSIETIRVNPSLANRITVEDRLDYQRNR
jgi:hypothetical protein